MPTDHLVFGESTAELVAELLQVHIEPDDGNGMTGVSGSFASAGPLIRAIFRAEAELLLADADAMAAGARVNRLPEERTADAFVLVAVRAAEAVAAAKVDREASASGVRSMT